MSEVEVTQVNPVTPDPVPVESVDLSKHPVVEQEQPANPLKDWVEQQNQMQTEALAEKDAEVEAKEQAKLEVNKDLVEASEEEVESDPQMSARFAALSKREKAAVERERKIKEQEEKYKFLEENMDELKRSPKKVLTELGIDFEQFTSAYLDELDGKEVKQSPEELIAEIDKKNSARWQQWEEQQRQMEEARAREVETSYKRELKAWLSSEDNVGKYELINAKDAHEVVYGVIQEHFETTQKETGEGQLLSPEEAAQLVEEHFEAEAEKYLNTSKFSKRLAPEPEEKKEKKSVTLSNRSTGGALAVDHKDDLSKLSKTEISKREAAKKLKWD